MPTWGHRDSEAQPEDAHQAEHEVHETQEPAVSESPAGTDAPVPVLTGKVVTLDEETAVKDPALGSTAKHQADGVNDAQTGDQALAEAQEPTVTGTPEAAVTEAELSEAQVPAAADAPEPAVPEARDSAEPNATEPGIAVQQRWSEILVSFVDDPRGSVTMAADAVDEAIDELVTSIRARQRVLASSWQGSQADTEQFRTALRDYRKLWHQVRQLDTGGKTLA